METRTNEDFSCEKNMEEPTLNHVEEEKEEKVKIDDEPNILSTKNDEITENVVCVDKNPAFIEAAVDNVLLEQLKDEMGFSTVVAEKALYYTHNESIETAIGWLTEHQDDPDFEAPIPSGPKLTEEEALARAVELQRRLREARQKREKEDELEKEKRRIQLGKNMLQTQRLLDEAARKRTAEQAIRDKQFHEEEKARQLELLKREWEERFGKPYPEQETQNKEGNISLKKPKDQVAYWIGRLRMQRTSENTKSFISCLNTLKVYISNIEKEPDNPKFQRIKRDNEAFKTRVLPFESAALPLLETLGFSDNGEGFLCLHGSPDTFLFTVALKFINLLLTQVSAIA